MRGWDGLRCAPAAPKLCVRCITKEYWKLRAVLEFITSVPDDYKNIYKELKDRGLKHLKTLVFFSYFTLGFAFFNLYLFEEYSADAILSVLFNERLLAFSVGATILFLLLYFLFLSFSHKSALLNSGAKAFRWVAECCFEFSFGLIVVYLVGFAIHAPISVESMPWLDLTKSYVYVFSNICALFLAIAFELWVFVDKNVGKRTSCIVLVLFVSVSFFLGAVVANLIR